jgi:hypothetical protein
MSQITATTDPTTMMVAISANAVRHDGLTRVILLAEPI